MVETPPDNLDDDVPAQQVSTPTKDELHYGWMKHFAEVQLKVLYTLIVFISAVVVVNLAYKLLVIEKLSKISENGIDTSVLEAYSHAVISPHDLITLVLPIFAFLVGMGSSGSSGK